jgi:DNA-binding transcriptional ArsR family regulator/protein-L-isoaspartate O-methyltransferase
MQPLTETGAGRMAHRWELYRLLAEPVRLRLLALAAEEELAIGELAELLGESQPNVSRHAAPLRQAGLLAERREGTRTLVRVPTDVARDAVVADALESGRSLCEADGSLGRVPDVLRARDALAREFFAKPAKGTPSSFPGELGAYLTAISPLLPRRSLAVDAGTGDGGLLDVLAPLYERVIGIDRSEAQLERALERVALRGYDNVALLHGEVDSPEVTRAVGAAGADTVFASRLLHHAPRPALFMEKLADLVSPGGSLVVIDYARHHDEAMRAQADVWLGFEPAELKRLARAAHLEEPRVLRVPLGRCGKGVDGHLIWQVLVAQKPALSTGTAKKTINGKAKRRGVDHG